MNRNLRRQTQEWLRGDASPEQARRTVRRLLTKLAEEGLADRAEKALARALPSWSADEYAPAVARAVDEAMRANALLESERERSMGSLTGYLTPRVEVPPAGGMAPSVSQTWAFVHGLVSENFEIDHPDPVQAVELAQTGVDIALKLDEATYGAERVGDLRALAYAKLGNALRIQTEIRAAEIAFEHASEELAAGTGDPIIAARVRLAEVSVHGIQRRYEEAFQLVDRVVATARRFGDRHLLGKALLTRAFYESNADHAEEAMRLSQRGLRFVDASQEPRLVIVAWHNVDLIKVATRRPWTGCRISARCTRGMVAGWTGSDSSGSKARSTWFGESHCGRRTPSSGCGSVSSKRTSVSTPVSLDLAHVYARQGRSEDMRRLAREMIPIFESRDMHQEAIAALLVFKRATEMDQVSVRLVEDLTAFLRRARGNPKLQFQPRS